MPIGNINGTAKGTGARFNDGKVDYSFIPLSTLDEEAKVWMAGAKKYTAFNWCRGMSWSAVLASLMRHLAAWQSGEDLDPETGLSHLGHAACNLRMLTLYAKTYPEGDDRPKEWITEYRQDGVNPPGAKIIEEICAEMEKKSTWKGNPLMNLVTHNPDNVVNTNPVGTFYPEGEIYPDGKCGSGFERDEKMGWPEYTPLVSVTGGSDVRFENCSFYAAPSNGVLITSDEPLPDIFPVDPEELT